MLASRALSACNVFRSDSVDDTVAWSSAVLWPHRLTILGEPRRLAARFDGLHAPDLSVLCLRYGADVCIDAGRIANSYLIRRKLTGRGELRFGRRVIETYPGLSTITSPSLPTFIAMDARSWHLLVRLPRTLVEGCLQTLLGREPALPLVFEPLLAPGGEAAAVWERTLDYLGCQAAALAAGDDGERLARALAEHASWVLLETQPHNYSAALAAQRHRAAAPRHVRLAAEYIEANLARPLTMIELARVAGVTPRTLQNGFRRAFGVSPSEFIRNLRLARLHEALQAAGEDETVTDAMLSVGIQHFGRYARWYRERYGCSPAATLRRR